MKNRAPARMLKGLDFWKCFGVFGAFDAQNYVKIHDFVVKHLPYEIFSPNLFHFPSVDGL